MAYFPDAVYDGYDSDFCRDCNLHIDRHSGPANARVCPPRPLSAAESQRAADQRIFARWMHGCVDCGTTHD